MPLDCSTFSNILTVKYNGIELKYLKYGSEYVWSQGWKLVLSGENTTHAKITVTISSSPYNQKTGTIDEIHLGDSFNIKIEPQGDYVLRSWSLINNGSTVESGSNLFIHDDYPTKSITTKSYTCNGKIVLNLEIKARYKLTFKRDSTDSNFSIIFYSKNRIPSSEVLLGSVNGKTDSSWYRYVFDGEKIYAKLVSDYSCYYELRNTKMRCR